MKKVGLVGKMWGENHWSMNGNPSYMMTLSSSAPLLGKK